jgi:hypothetical protein
LAPTAGVAHVKLKIPADVLKKLNEKHGVTFHQVVECFANRNGAVLYDVREEHRTNPPTKWFIAETDMGVKLKVVYIRTDSEVIVKTAYPPNPEEIDIYCKKANVRF